MRIGFQHIPGFMQQALIILLVVLACCCPAGYGQAPKDPAIEDSTSATPKDSLAAARSIELKRPAGIGRQQPDTT